MGYLAEMAPGRRPEVTAVHAAGGGTYVIEWQPKFARDASTLAASLARHDVRERALAIRKGRLHALRLLRRPRTPATVAAPG